MNRELRKSWWRELGAISRGLDAFQGGGGFDLPATQAAPALAPPRRRSARHNVAQLLRELVYLGGRPMHAGHNDDIDEPFDILPLANGCESG